MVEGTSPEAWQGQASSTLPDLMERVGRQDREAFGLIYQETSSKVYSLALRLLKNGSLAEEISQDVYMHLWREAKAYDSTRGKPLTWILTVCHHRCVERIRSEEARRKREERASLDAALIPAEPEAPYRESARAALPESLDELSSKQREVIGLVYYEGMTLGQAAEELSIPLPTAKTRVRDALKKLRTTMRSETNV